MTQDNFMNKVSKLESELEQKDMQLERKSMEIIKMQEEFNNLSIDNRSGQKLRGQLDRITQESQRELNQSRKSIRRKDREIDTLQKDLKRKSFFEKKLNKKIV